MAELSEFERQRQENIKKNKELLRQLNLDSLDKTIKSEVHAAEKAKRKKRATTPTKRVKKEVEPSRKSRRIAGIKTETENPEEFKRLQEEQEEKDRQKKEIERLKSTRLFGDFKLIDLVTEKLGGLKFEGKVIKKETENEVKQDDDVDIQKEKEALSLLRSLGEKFSASDFYDLIRQSPSEYTDKDLQKKRKEFDNLHIYSKFDPLDVKITHNRITAINFHPSTENRVIVAGDTSGDVGIWAVDSKTTDDEPVISIIKPHGKSISRILTPVKTPTKILTSSYDGSVRQLDLNKLDSTEVAYINDPYESGDYPLGVSDINLCYDDPNLLYLTTLSGNFYKHDLRTKFKLNKKDLLRLSDKKIGSFSINPNNSNQIATASLDRTLKIWDLRNVSKSNAEWSEYEDQYSPHLYGGFTSRLSISGVDWNHENRLVCNGYSDNIYVFDLSGNDKLPLVNEWKQDYTPDFKPTEDSEEVEIPVDTIKPLTKIKHNCQTGRWVSILKSKWQTQPEDGIQKFVIANMKRGLDIFDQNGKIIGHLSESVGAVPAVCGFHPTKNWVVGGSASGKVYLFNENK